jgi:SAM-dependent methyltransferase
MFRLDWIEALHYKSAADAVFFCRNYLWVRRNTRRLVAGVDRAAFDQVGQSLPRANFNPLYLDLADTMGVSLYRLRRLGLDSGPSHTILDIGTGPGLFPYVCQKFGHRVVCTDIDNKTYFNDITELLKLDRRLWRVERNVPAPDFGTTFDLVTATNIGFNVIPPGRRKEWFTDEWDFFLADLASRVVSPRGRIYLTINQLQKRNRDASRDRALLDHFAEQGAVFPSYGHILFEDMSRLVRAKAQIAS